jgi:outer membrane receptor protein involved in Fe transport
VEQSRNPDLDAETSTATALGIIWTPLGRSADLVAELNYYNIDARQRVISLNTTTLLEAEDVIPPGLVIRDAAGNLTRLVLKPFNSATDESEGFDGRVSFGRETSLGYFRAQVSGTYQLRLERQLVRDGAIVDNSRNTGFSPKWKLRGGLSWRRGGLTASAFLNHIPGATNVTFRLPNGALQEIDPWTTVDLSAAYDFGDTGSLWTNGLRLSVSILNLFDRDPPFANGFLAYDPSRTDPRGRFINFTLDKRF